MALALLSRGILLGLWQVMLIECHECGGKVSTEAKACVRCGAPPQMPAKCHECEALMPVNSRICKECGAPVVAGVGTPALPRPAILDEQVVDSKPAPPPLPLSRIEHVNFDSARYQAYCPLCRNRFYVKGSALKKDDVVRCPNHKKGSRGGIYKVSDLRIFQREGEVVRYHVLKDMFSYSGRISLKTYWISFAILLVPALLLGGVIGSMIWQPLIYVVWFAVFHPIWIKRLQDLGCRLEWILIPASFVGFMVCWYLIAYPTIIRGAGESFPMLTLIGIISGLGSAIFCFIVSVLPGTKLLNRYGPPTSRIGTEWP